MVNAKRKTKTPIKTNIQKSFSPSEGPLSGGLGEKRPHLIENTTQRGMKQMQNIKFGIGYNLF